MDMNLILIRVGAVAFGLVIGWCASYAISQQSRFGLAQLSALIAAIAGGAISARFDDRAAFGGYCVGLALTFFLHRFCHWNPVRDYLEQAMRQLKTPRG